MGVLSARHGKFRLRQVMTQKYLQATPAHLLIFKARQQTMWPPCLHYLLSGVWMITVHPHASQKLESQTPLYFEFSFLIPSVLSNVSPFIIIYFVKVSSSSTPLEYQNLNGVSLTTWFFD